MHLRKMGLQVLIAARMGQNIIKTNFFNSILPALERANVTGVHNLGATQLHLVVADQMLEHVERVLLEIRREDNCMFYPNRKTVLFQIQIHKKFKI